MSPTGLPARRSAHYLLMQITTEGKLLSELIAGGALARLPAEDRARAQRLALDVLRAMGQLDHLLAPFLKKAPPPFVAHALRLGTAELLAGEAAHGVVNTYVEIVARNRRTQSMKGLINAVLRKIAALPPGSLESAPPPKLPAWLRQPLISAWGRKAVTGMETAHAAGAPLDLTAKADPAIWAERLGGTLLPTGSIRVAAAGQVSALPGYDSGDWWVQDAAAALPVRLLGDIRGQRVLDLCAAPGGKTMQLAAAGAEVTAVDVSPRRIARLADNLARTGLTAELITTDAFAFAPEAPGFDAVLLDAPCSATGTLRRHPDLPFAKDGAEFAMLIDQQARLIDHALGLLGPGGRLVFCTCSLLPDEGEVQITDALARHPGLTVDKAARARAGVDPAWHTPEGGLRLRPDLWPGLGGMDGFYMAVLTKPA